MGSLLKPPLTTLLSSYRFHSISFPSEWGEFLRLSIFLRFPSFHSISFPSEWGVNNISIDFPGQAASFHSISFPSEWGVTYKPEEKEEEEEEVSIQLVSPASGEQNSNSGSLNPENLFPFN